MKVINNDDNKLHLPSKTNISIRVGNVTIDMGNNYCKEDLILVFSALKEIGYAN